MAVADQRHEELLARLDDIARAQGRLEHRLRDVLRAQIDQEDVMAQSAEDIAKTVGEATVKIRDTRQAMNTGFHALLDKIAALAAQGDLSAVESAVSGLRGEVDTLTSDVLANTPADEPSPATPGA